MAEISVVINTYNAELYLDKVLSAISSINEIVICDMYSTDKTIEIAKKYNAKIIYHEKLNYVEPARNFAIQSAKNEWVLLLDADEIIPKKLLDYLIYFSNNSSHYSAVAIPRKNYFLNQFMHASYPDYVYRFFKKSKINWPKNIHSIPEIDGEVFYIDKKKKYLALEHLENHSISTMLNKTNKYTDAEISKRGNKKINWFKLIFSPLIYFAKFYFIKGGIKDGKAGFLNAVFASYYKFITLAKLYENQL